MQECGSGRLQKLSGRHGLQVVTSQSAYCSTIVVASSPYYRAWAQFPLIHSYFIDYAECHWYHFEYQARGSTHAYGCAKLKNDPGICSLAQKAAST